MILYPSNKAEAARFSPCSKSSTGSDMIFSAGSIICSRFLFNFGGERLLAKKACVSMKKFGHGKCALLPVKANSWVLCPVVMLCSWRRKDILIQWRSLLQRNLRCAGLWITASIVTSSKNEIKKLVKSKRPLISKKSNCAPVLRIMTSASNSKMQCDSWKTATK